MINFIKKEELITIFDNAKSFYKKAKVKYYDDCIILESYNTNILIMQDGRIKYICNKYDLTQTTLRHIKEFLKQYKNIFNVTKKDILKELEG